MAPVALAHFSDVLCVWAFFAEPRLDEVRRNFGDRVRIDHRFCSVFGDVPGKIATAWGAKGGYAGFADHLQHAAEKFSDVALHADLWRTVRPVSSLSPHIFLKAILLGETEGLLAPGAFDSALGAMRAAFFLQGRDIGRRAIQREVARECGLPLGVIEDRIEDGRAYAGVAADYRDAEALGVKGSPTLLLNDGRQKLYGNVGYRIIDANIQELLREPNPDQASWC